MPLLIFIADLGVQTSIKSQDVTVANDETVIFDNSNAGLIMVVETVNISIFGMVGKTYNNNKLIFGANDRITITKDSNNAVNVYYVDGWRYAIQNKLGSECTFHVFTYMYR